MAQSADIRRDDTAGNAVVKSAGRAFEVLELFRQARGQLNAAEIGHALGYPKSSTNALLKSLVHLGYLSLNPVTLRYFPSMSVTRLGDWIPSVLSASGDVLAILSEVHATTQETVTLSVQSDLTVSFLRVLPGTFPISLTMTEGFVAPLFGTAVGTAILSLLPDAEIAPLAARHDARTRVRAEKVDLAKALAAIAETRASGYCVAYDAVFPDTAALAVPYPSEIDGFPMAIGVGGLRDRIRRNEKAIFKSIRASITRHIGLTQKRPRA